jgi:thymidylate synthase
MDTSVKQINIEDGVNGYVDLVQHVLRYGAPAAPKGINTREIEDAVITIDNVYATLPIGVSRGTVPGIGAVEACQLMSGLSTPKLVIDIGPQFEDYTEEDGKFHGSYGTRTSGQYNVVVDRLRNDPDTRQAVVTMWSPPLDMLERKKDYPCTILHQFRIRNGKLNMSVYMRSNDVWLGAAYDFFQFTRVQLALCSILSIEPGTYAHHVGSLHIYENNYSMAENLKKTSDVFVPPAITGHTWNEVAASASRALRAIEDTEAISLLTEEERWYADSMSKAIRKNKQRKEAQ